MTFRYLLYLLRSINKIPQLVCSQWTFRLHPSFCTCCCMLFIRAVYTCCRQKIQHTGDRGNGGHFTSWLFKTIMHSTDYRVGVFDWSNSKKKASGKARS